MSTPKPAHGHGSNINTAEKHVTPLKAKLKPTGFFRLFLLDISINSGSLHFHVCLRSSNQKSESVTASRAEKRDNGHEWITSKASVLPVLGHHCKL